MENIVAAVFWIAIISLIIYKVKKHKKKRAAMTPEEREKERREQDEYIARAKKMFSNAFKGSNVTKSAPKHTRIGMHTFDNMSGRLYQCLETMVILRNTVNFSTFTGRFDFLLNKRLADGIISSNITRKSTLKFALYDYQHNYPDQPLTDDEMTILLECDRKRLYIYFENTIDQFLERFINSQNEQISKLKTKSAILKRQDKIKANIEVLKGLKEQAKTVILNQ